MKTLLNFLNRDKSPKKQTPNDLFKIWFSGKKKLADYTDDQLLEAERYASRIPTANFHYWSAITTEAMRRRGEL